MLCLSVKCWTKHSSVFKTYDTEFDEIIVKVIDENGRPLKVHSSISKNL